ncbi:MAG TPA: hypothetical protein VK174_18565 [Chitinophagales bacterium]|nr:hypothetical protein [Chitinophagales bacterium]
MHRHEQGGICVCDSGWGGPNCSIPVGALVGAYHVTGLSTQWLVGNVPSSQSIDDTMMVSYQNDTFIAYNYKHTYTGVDTSNYTFKWTTGAQPYSKLTFRKSLNDSVFYESRTGGSGGGVTKYLKGVKLR